MAAIITQWRLQAIADALDELECYLHDVKYLFEAIDYEKSYGKDAADHVTMNLNHRRDAIMALGLIRLYLKLIRK